MSFPGWPPPSTASLMRPCSLPSCNCSTYVRSLLLSFILAGLLAMNIAAGLTFIFTFITGLLEMNVEASPSFYPFITNPFFIQTNNGQPSCCICLHEEALHSNQPSSVPPPPTIVPSMINRPYLPGIPMNSSVPILRNFQPPQTSLSSSTEEGRQRSIAHMNTVAPPKTKKKGRQPTKTISERVVSPPIKDVSILFLPLNVFHF